MFIADVRVQVPPRPPISFLNLTSYGRVVELVDSLDSGSSVHCGRAGSSPASPTKKRHPIGCLFYLLCWNAHGLRSTSDVDVDRSPFLSADCWWENANQVPHHLKNMLYFPVTLAFVLIFRYNKLIHFTYFQEV